MTPAPPKITVLLADDHEIVREGFRILLESEDDLEVVGEAENGRRALELARQLRPAVVVMDLAMPLLNGIGATRQIMKELPDTKVIVFSGHSDPEHLNQVLHLAPAGYLIKQNSAEVLAEAIRAVHAGRRYYCPTVLRCLTRQGIDPAQLGKPGAGSFPCLTNREEEVLQLIAEGLANKQIAAELRISIKTVEKHRQNLMRKLDIHDIAGLTRHAISAGVVESSGFKTDD